MHVKKKKAALIRGGRTVTPLSGGGITYLSRWKGKVHNVNGKVNDPLGKPIVCRHIALGVVRGTFKPEKYKHDNLSDRQAMNVVAEASEQGLIPSEASYRDLFDWKKSDPNVVLFPQTLVRSPCECH